MEEKGTIQLLLAFDSRILFSKSICDYLQPASKTTHRIESLNRLGKVANPTGWFHISQQPPSDLPPWQVCDLATARARTWLNFDIWQVALSVVSCWGNHAHL